MRARLVFSGLLLSRLAVCDALPATDVSSRLFGNPLVEDLILWSVGLLTISALLALVFWGFRKFNGAGAPFKDKLRVVGGLSLGMWEKVVLLQAGDKQLVLGVTPGRIQTLQVLEDDERLFNAEKAFSAVKEAAAQKLKAEMPAPAEANPVSADGGKASADLLARASTAAEYINAGCGPDFDKEDSLHLFSPQSYQKHLESVLRLIDQNPKLAAQTLKAWIRDE